MNGTKTIMGDIGDVKLIDPKAEKLELAKTLAMTAVDASALFEQAPEKGSEDEFEYTKEITVPVNAYIRSIRRGRPAHVDTDVYISKDQIMAAVRETVESAKEPTICKFPEEGMIFLSSESVEE